jgi:hypothetical protein
MRPRIATSFRPHGKWGDFIAAIIPTVWCVNIICNSNFILRLIEWQTESSLLTIRVRARQWYWVYKFDAKAVVDIFTAPKNIGRDKWLFSTLHDVSISESYMDLLELRAQNEWLQGYWNSYLSNEALDKKESIAAPLDALDARIHSIKLPLIEDTDLLLLSCVPKAKELFFGNDSMSDCMQPNLSSVSALAVMWNAQSADSFFLTGGSLPVNLLSESLAPYAEVPTTTAGSILNFSTTVLGTKVASQLLELSSSYIEVGQLSQTNDISSLASAISVSHLRLPQSQNSSIDFLENSRFIKRTQGLNVPLRLVKALFHDSSATEVLLLQWGDGASEIKHKLKPYTTYLTFKQKRYKRKKFINFTSKNTQIDSNLVNVKWKPVLINNRFFKDSELDPTVSYKMIKKLKKKDDSLPLVLSKRLLRVKRTLVLPAHINLTVITSSYDIIHSWFIPGLGLKLDCVPGRSTHHTFYIDNVGFYIGQCAEICGRYHHHMPIRVCALPFDHFLTWWYHFGLPKLMFTNNNFNYGFRKYSW